MPSRVRDVAYVEWDRRSGRPPVHGLRAAAAALAILACCAATPSVAQTTPAGGQGDLQQSLFQKVLRDPSNVDANLRHAEAATAAGDYEAAIGSLERILFFNPNLPSIRYELGVLYFRLGSYELARTYFETAIAGAGTSAELRARAETYLAEIARRLSPSLLAGYFQIGAQYDTNANAGANLSSRTGLDTALDQRFVKKEDGSAFGLMSLRHVLDFGNQRGDTWETALRGYGTAYHELHHLNTALVETSTGPRLAVFPEQVKGLSVRPYGSIGGVMLGGQQYLLSRSLGASVRWAPEAGWALEAGGDHAWRTFRDTDELPDASDQSGTYKSGWAQLSGPFLFGTTWSTRFTIADNAAQTAPMSFLYRAFDLSLTYSFPVKLGDREVRVSATPFAGIATTRYDAPDPDVTPTAVRNDLERRVGLVLDTQFDKNWGVGIKLQYTHTNSSIPEFRTENFSVLGGPTYRF